MSSERELCVALTSTSQHKVTVVKQLLERVYRDRFILFADDSSDEAKTIQQPINQTLDCAKTRVLNFQTKYKLRCYDYILSIENGIEESTGTTRWSDVCLLYVVDKNGQGNFYKSFGIQLHDEVFKKFQDELRAEPTLTYGKFLAKTTNNSVDPTNWMKDARFGNIDRKEMIEDVMVQWLIDLKTAKIPNYPKPGVLFKDISSLLEESVMLQLLVERFQKVGALVFDIQQLDYIAGLQSRGYLLAAPIAYRYNKKLLSVRKKDKLPIPADQANKVVSKNYKKEYGDDSFAIVKKPEYVAKACLIVDDLFATGGSLHGARAVLEKAWMLVVGYLTVYDVEALRRNNVNNGTRCYVMVRTNDPQIPFSVTPKPLMYYPEKKTFVCDWMLNSCDKNAFTILSCSKSQALSEKIAQHLKAHACAITLGKFHNGETRVEINENIRNKHIIAVCQTCTGSVNDDFAELELILDASNRAGAGKITIVLPYYPYARSDKKDKRGVPIGAALVADKLKMLQVHHVISLDLHAGQLQGLIPKGFHNLYVIKYMAEYLNNRFLLNTKKNEFVLVAPDVGSLKRTESYAKLLQMNHVVLHKQRDYSNPGTVMKSIIIGDQAAYNGKTGIVIDDIGDTFGTMISATNELVKNGMKNVIVAVTHGVLSDQALECIKNCKEMIAVIVTNSLPQTMNLRHCEKLELLDVSELISRAIDGIVHGKSVSKLFE